MADGFHISLEQIARALGGEISGGQVLAPGPNHSAEDRSLAVKLGRDGGLVVYSHAGDDIWTCKDHVHARLGLPPWNGKAKANGPTRAIVAEYDYCDETGKLLFQVVRFAPKKFAQRRPNGNGGWSWKLGNVPRKLYRLPELIEAVANDHPVFICEGEKAVNAFATIGIPATCSPHGAGKWRDGYSPYLKGAKVIILPDNDEPGRRHAEQVAESLRGVAASVKVLALPGLPEHGDAYDWLNTGGGTAEKLWTLVEALGADGPDIHEEPQSSDPPKQAPKYNSFTVIRVADVEPMSIDWLWPDYLARGKLTLLGGDPDQGKSMLCIDAAARHSRGAHWPHGPRAKIGGTLFICSEDGIADTVRPRAEAAGADLDMLHVFESSLIRGGKRKTFSLQNDLDMLGEAIDRLGNVSLVVVDAITSYMGRIDGHKAFDVRPVLEPVSGFAERHRVSVLGVTHPPKIVQGNALRAFAGSFAFVAAPRLAFFVMSEPETDRHLLLAVKNNIGPKARGLGYFITTKQVSKGIIAPHILWDDAPVDFTADQAMAAANEASKDPGALKQAMDFLREALGKGPVEATDTEEAAEANGISKRTLDRARTKLRVKATKTGFKGGWVWSL